MVYQLNLTVNCNLMETSRVTRKRSIRSFVRRGRMTPGQSRAFDIFWTKYGIDLSHINHLRKVFGRDAPLVLEIGFGMGDSLLAIAQTKPEWNFLGVEVYRPGIASLLAKIEKYQVNNVHILYVDAVEVLQNIDNASLDQIQIFFPDPWPKRRQQKRRLIQSEFVELAFSKLKKNGKILLASDSESYAQQMLQIFSNHSSNHSGFYNPAGERKFSPRIDYRPLTKYEKRGQNLGHQVWDLVFIKN